MEPCKSEIQRARERHAAPHRCLNAHTNPPFKNVAAKKRFQAEAKRRRSQFRLLLQWTRHRLNRYDVIDKDGYVCYMSRALSDPAPPAAGSLESCRVSPQCPKTSRLYSEISGAGTFLAGQWRRKNLRHDLPNMAAMTHHQSLFSLPPIPQPTALPTRQRR